MAEEANDNVQNLPKILERAMRQFADMKLKISDDRDFWQEQAAHADKEGYPGVAAGLIEVSADVNVLPHERRRVWEAEAGARCTCFTGTKVQIWRQMVRQRRSLSASRTTARTVYLLYWFSVYLLYWYKYWRRSRGRVAH